MSRRSPLGEAGSESNGSLRSDPQFARDRRSFPNLWRFERRCHWKRGRNNMSFRPSEHSERAEESVGLSWRALTAISIDLSARNLRVLGRDDKIGVVSGSAVGMTIRVSFRARPQQSVIPTERRNQWVLGRIALSPHSIDPSARTHWALGRDDSENQEAFINRSSQG